MKTKSVVIAVIIIILLAGLAFWYWQSRKAATAPEGLGRQIFEQTQNPIKDVLPPNPFSNYKNPFAQ